MDILHTIVFTIFTLALVITIHEFGHFWVARRCGVKVLRFSIGFGKPLLLWRDKQNTEFVLAAVPLGGYVKMLDERAGEVTPGQEHLAFNRKPVWSRIAVTAAGPLANLLLAVLAWWFLFLSGETGVAPVLGAVEQGSVADSAGLEAGQEIVAIDGHPTPTWRAVNFRLLDRIGDAGSMDFSVRYPGSDLVYQSSGNLAHWQSMDTQPDLIRGLGIEPFQPETPPLLDTVVVGSPAHRAGLQPADLILSVDGRAVGQWRQWVEYVRARPGQSIGVVVQRNGAQQAVTVTPARQVDPDGTAYGQVGVTVQPPQWPEHMLRQFHYGPWQALVLSGQRTWYLTSFTLESIGKMLRGQISSRNLSGPVTIAKVASATAQSGLKSYVAFVALLSVSLGVLNLLPIPVLDGGHLMYYTFELLFRRPVPMKLQILGYQVGLVIIVGVMLLALYNDFTRL